MHRLVRVRRHVLRSTVVAIALLVGAAVPAAADDHAARSLSLFVGESAAVAAGASVTHAVVIDDSICRADVQAGTLRVTGLKRGDTVVVAWIDNTPSSLIVHVDVPPAPTAPHEPTSQELDAIGRGTVGTLAHIGSSSAGERRYSFLTPFNFVQGTAARKFAVTGQVQSALSSGAAASNVDTVSAQWTTPGVTVDVADFALSLDSGDGRITPPRADAIVALRGGEIVWPRDGTTYRLFAGATAPWFAGSRELAGGAFRRNLTNDVVLFGTTGWLRVPQVAADRIVGAETSVFQTVGVRARVNDRAAFEAAGGASTAGMYAGAALSWQSDRVSAEVDARHSSPEFPLNQIQLVFAASDLAHADVGWKATRRLAVGGSYQQSIVQPTPLFPAHVRSENGALNVRFALTARQTLFGTYTIDDNRGGLGAAADRTGRRIDAGLSSEFGTRVANTAQISTGALADPLQLATRSEFALRDNVSLGFGRNSINIGFSHERLDASLVSRLNEQIALLAPALQPVFRDDPVAFVESPLMPPDLRVLLQSLQPVDTQLNVSAQLAAGRRLSVSPTYTYSHNAQSPLIASDSHSFGYGLTWRATRKLELQSTLSQALVFDARRAGFARTTIASAGFRYAFTGIPQWIAPAARTDTIGGRVFRDVNMNGRRDGPDTPLAGITVTLSTGRTAVTDSQGRFEFDRLEPGEYQVSLPLQQFHAAIRATTDVELTVRLFENRRTEVEFGLVDFSRLLGTVFNDYAMSGVREADAPGLRDVRLKISGAGIEREITTGGGGDFEIDDLPPGRYRIAVDSATLPNAYVAGGNGPVDVELKPSTTAVVDVPVRATRSLAGQVVFVDAGRVASGESGRPAAVPLKGVRIDVVGRVAVTDDEGRFVVRDLPAGPIDVRLVPARPLPADLLAPAGVVTLPKEPLQIDNAVITIGNPRLVEYLAPPAVDARRR